MSWSITIPPTVAAQFAATVEAAQLPAYMEPTSYGHDEAQDQLVAAKNAVLNLFHSGALGSPTSGVYSATMGGHANPDHTPTGGWASDAVNVSIQQVTYPQYIAEAEDRARQLTAAGV